MITAVVLVAGALGAVARYEVAGWVQRRTRSGAPLGTAVVNVTGTIALGLILALASSGHVTRDWLLVAGTGSLGAYTTFSTWMFESVRLAEEGRGGGLHAATLNLVLPLVAGSLVAWLLIG